MKPEFVIAKDSQRAEAGSARIVILVLISFLLGVAVTAFWFRHATAGNAGTGTTISPGSETAAQAPAPERVGIPAPAPAPVPQPPIPQPTDPAVIEQVKKAVPNFATISLDEGEQTLRAAALKAFGDATAENGVQIKAAQQQLLDIENHGSAADQQAAMKRFQDAQAAAAEKLKEIGANLQAQIAALKSLKNQQ